MRKNIHGHDKPLKNAIQMYRDIVLNADIHPSLTLLAKILPECKEEETLESLKNKIEKAISAEGAKPFAIFIDDLDRLEGDELFEVLRLIRVTANFRNMVFVVAYDREYICNVLNQSKNIERAEEYIQKYSILRYPFQSLRKKHCLMSLWKSFLVYIPLKRNMR